MSATGHYPGSHEFSPLFVTTDGGDGLQVLRVAANRMNKQSRMKRGGSAARGLGGGLSTPHSKQQQVTKFYTGTRTWTDSLEMDVEF